MRVNNIRLIQLSVIVIFPLLFLNFKHVKSVENSCGCDYAGSIQRVLFGNHKYKFASMQLGQYYYAIDWESCKISDGNTIELSGTVVFPTTRGFDLQAIPNIAIEECYISNGYLVKGEVLTITDNKGYFYFKTILDDSTYIVIHQTAEFGMCYAISGFKRIK